MSEKALLIIDMQVAFFRGDNTLPKIPEAEGKSLIDKIKGLRKYAQQNRIPIIYTIDSFSREEADIEPHFKLFGVHAIEGEEGIDVVSEIAPRRGDFLIRKLRYDAFFGTRLDLILRELKVDTLLFSGIWLDACVLHTIMGAFFRCYKTILLEDCTATPYEEDRKHAINYITKYYGTEISTLTKCLQDT